ncbi:cytochrome P450 [Longispora sp. K20-0274]|uniref:cytochrome P450 n=1 Tax=Longispora sp. K20-0274 TaxID=3088255 RepID=UPI00399AC22A
MITFHRYADVTAALADPALAPPPAEPGPPGTMAWLRATVARFSTGEAHARRRALVEADLARLSPPALRTAATSDNTDASGRRASSAEPRHVIVRTLAAALGLAEPDAVAEAVALAATTYFGGEDPAADAAVAWLVPRMTPIQAGPAAPDVAPDLALDAGAASDLDADPAADPLEVAANRIGLLIQACDATAGLVAHARRAAGTDVWRPVGGRPDRLAGTHVGDIDGADPGRSAEDVFGRVDRADPGRLGDADTDPAGALDGLLREVLRHDPPVRVMRRVAVADTRIGGVDIPAGQLVILDIAAANRDPEVFADPDVFDPARGGPDSLTFGGAPRLCLGRAHALALAAGVLAGAGPESSAPDNAEDVPETDDRDPAQVVAGMVDRVLALAATWVHWDGRPRPVDDRVYTPHKAVRRVADHLVDHLAEMEARLAGEETVPDHWHASMVTTVADLAPFTQVDLDEARSRLTRLARIWANRLNALTPAQLDHSPGTGWTFRQLAFHVSGSDYYADALGDLTPGKDLS